MVIVLIVIAGILALAILIMSLLGKVVNNRIVLTTFLNKVTLPVLAILITLILGVMQNQTQKELATMQNQNQKKFEEIKWRVDSSQINISRGQIAVNLIDHIVKGTAQEKNVAFEVLKATGNQLLANNIIVAMASSGNQEIQKQGLDGIREVGISGVQALIVAKSFSVLTTRS